jgi:hypothetical protein
LQPDAGFNASVWVLTCRAHLPERGNSAAFGPGGAWRSAPTYLLHRGFTQLTSYQPASRFWPFQWIEGGWLLALSLLLIAATVWLVRRRAV